MGLLSKADMGISDKLRNLYFMGNRESKAAVLFPGR